MNFIRINHTDELDLYANHTDELYPYWFLVGPYEDDLYEAYESSSYEKVKLEKCKIAGCTINFAGCA